MPQRRILVTGGAGFIGSHLVDGLLADGNSVCVIDNESTGSQGNVATAADFIRGDVRSDDDLRKAFDPVPDGVFHIAGQASIKLAYANPGEDLGVNVGGTVKVLEHCLERGVPRLVFAGSMTVYGNPLRVPTPEDEPPAPVSFYGTTKYAAERYVHLTGARTDLDPGLGVSCLRMFNVYGPRQSLSNPYQGVLAIFLGNLLRGEPIRIDGDGEQSRDFVFIDDVVRAWIACLDDPQSVGRVLNLGSGIPTTINALCDAVLDQFGHSRSTYPVTSSAEQQGDVRSSAADITAIQKTLGWAPKVALGEGLRQTVEWARQPGVHAR
jgi:UDP-glucose 4-epimerase